jgi:hypothetical protein
MSSISATFNTGFELIEGLHQFLIKGHTLPPVYSCVGGGYIDDAIGTSASTYELFKVSFSSPTDFSVSGTYNGAIGTGTVGNLFSSSVLKFTVTSAGAPFANGDYIHLQMTTPWEALTYSQGSTYVWRAPGNTNNYGPVVGVVCESNGSSNYFNATVYGFPTWQQTKTHSTQWKRFSGGNVPLGPAAGQACTLIARADGQFCYFVCLIGSTFTAGCIGFMDAFHSTDQHQQPLLLGSSVTTQVQWSHSSVRSPVYAQGSSSWSSPDKGTVRNGVLSSFLYMFKPNGRWAGVCDTNTSERDNTDHMSIYSGRYGSKFQVNLDGSVPFIPIYLRTSNIAGTSDNGNMWEQGYFGVIPFVKFMPCVNTDGSLINGNTILRDNTTRRKIVTIQNGYVADVSNTYAFELA